MDLRVKLATVSAALVNALKRGRIIGKDSRIISKDSRNIGKDSRIISKESGVIGRDSRIIGKDSRRKIIGLLVWTEVLHSCTAVQCLSLANTSVR